MIVTSTHRDGKSVHKYPPFLVLSALLWWVNGFQHPLKPGFAAVANVITGLGWIMRFGLSGILLVLWNAAVVHILRHLALNIAFLLSYPIKSCAEQPPYRLAAQTQIVWSLKLWKLHCQINIKRLSRVWRNASAIIKFQMAEKFWLWLVSVPIRRQQNVWRSALQSSTSGAQSGLLWSSGRWHWVMLAPSRPRTWSSLSCATRSGQATPMPSTTAQTTSSSSTPSSHLRRLSWSRFSTPRLMAPLVCLRILPLKTLLPPRMHPPAGRLRSGPLFSGLRTGLGIGLGRGLTWGLDWGLSVWGFGCCA